MMRRRLAAYTMMLIAGISAGYFIFEKVKLVSGILFLIGTGVAVFLLEDEGSGRETDWKENTAGLKAERVLCFSVMLLGFLIFAAEYSCFECARPETEQVEIYGRVLNAEDKSEYLRLTVDDAQSNYRVSVNISKAEDEATDLSYYIASNVRITGSVRDISGADNPGCFDYRRYMRSMGVAYSVKASDVRIDESMPLGIHKFRKHLIKERERFLSNFESENRGVLRGVIFGDKSEIDEEVLKEFNLNSSGHILAVSGLHIGFLYSLLRLISGKKRSLPVSLIVILIMTLYGEMTMWSSSTVRAVIVLSLSILSVNLRRPFDLLSSLSAAAFMILITRPYMLFNSGFQLSFSAMCSIAFLSKYLSAFLGNLLGAAASVQIGTIPLIAMNFHKVNSIALLINIPIIILSSIIVPAGVLILFISMATPALPGLCVSILSFLCGGLVSLNRTLFFEGKYSEIASGAGASLTVIIYLFIYILSSEWLRVNVIRKNHRIISRAAILLFCPLIMMSISLHNPFKNDEIVFVSVGQGDCTHISFGSEDILIDGGGSDFVNTGEKTLMPYLLTQGAKNVDLALVTHLHKDHYLGISELSEIYPLSSVGMPSEYRESFESVGNSKDNENAIAFNTDRIVYLSGNSDIGIADNVFIEVIWPVKERPGGIRIEDQNEHNMVYMINYNGCKVIVTGDLLEEDEIKMVRHYKGSDKLKCDILKVAHHGSKSSSSELFLDEADPKIAVIQVGRNNLYGHPHEQTLERLEARGIKTYRTDIHGAVGINIERNNKIRVHTMH